MICEDFSQQHFLNKKLILSRYDACILISINYFLRQETLIKIN